MAYLFCRPYYELKELKLSAKYRVANPDHLERLKNYLSRDWNRWRQENPDVVPDLSNADLRGVDREEINLCEANLIGANLTDAYLVKADLNKSILDNALLNKTWLNGASIQNASLVEAEVIEVHLLSTDLRGSNLKEASFRRSDLTGAHLDKANLRKADLLRTDFKRASLRGVDLRDAFLYEAYLQGSDLTGSNLTGACVKGWQLDSDTDLTDVVCNYAYLAAGHIAYEYQERRPISGYFKPDEFATLIQKVVETIDLIFVDGIDWQAFFQSFQKLCSQYADEELSIQAIEKKRGSSFVVRLEVADDVDKAYIEKVIKAEYAVQLQSVEAKYKELLYIQGRHLDDARSSIEAERQDKATLIGVISAMANSQQGPKYDLRGAQFAGGMAETVQGNQSGGTINNYGVKLEEVARLLSALREQAQTFPDEYREDALDAINDLELDLKEASPDPNRIGRRLKRLAAAASAAGMIAGGAATFSSDVKNFASNVVELTEVLDVPIEFVQPHFPNK